MRNAIGLLCLVWVGGVLGAVCDATYYLQGATQYMTVVRLWSTQQVASTSTTQLSASLQGMAVPDTSTDYKMISRFLPACGVAIRNGVTYLHKARGASATLTQGVFTDLFIDIFDSTELRLAGGTVFDLCFVLGPDTVNGRTDTRTMEYAIRRGGEGHPFELWYGNGRLLDSVRNPSTGRWAVGGMYVPDAQAGYDSAAIDAALRAVFPLTGYDDVNHHGALTLQLLKLTYDTTQAAVSFHPGQNALTSARGLSVMSGKAALVYDIMGRVVGRLTPANRLSLPSGSGYCIVRSQDKQFTVPSVRMQK
jgi:hypothetical protein